MIYRIVKAVRRYITGEDIKEARIEQLLTVAKTQPVQGEGVDQLIEFFVDLQKEYHRDHRSRR